MHDHLTRSLALALVAGLAAGTAAPADAAAHGKPGARAHHAAAARQRARVAPLPAGTARPSGEVVLGLGQGEQVNLPDAVDAVWTSNPETADVYVNNRRQIYLFGKQAGEGTVYATTKSGAVVYATNVRVAQNINSVDRMLRLAMPDARIQVTTAGQLAVLTGTVATPEDVAQAGSLVASMLNPGMNVNEPGAQLKMVVVNRLRAATPLQVNLHVKIAEVSRSIAKQIGLNVLTRDSTSGFQFGFAQGRQGAVTINPPIAPGVPGGGTFTAQDGKSAIAGFGRLLGVDVGAALDLAETDGLVTTLAEPNLTALSGETASFLAGGEFPIPIASTLGQVSVEFKQYGVSLAFTPTVLADGRISMRVRPEVSQLSSQGAVVLNGFTVPAITTRRTETTVELGSGQSFMISGLLQNNNTNSISKTPGLGDLPVLGALFRSNGYQRQQTELMIVVTPYLVKPINASDVVLPTDGLRNPTDLQNFLLGQDFAGRSGGQRPKPSMAPPVTVPAGSGRAASTPVPTPGFSY